MKEDRRSSERLFREWPADIPQRSLNRDRPAIDSEHKFFANQDIYHVNTRHAYFREIVPFGIL